MNNLTNNTFDRNTAIIKGGSIYYDLNQPNGLVKNIYKSNKAKYGNNYASYPS
jgi:hypothetical protein